MVCIKLSQLRVNLNDSDFEYALGTLSYGGFGLAPVHLGRVLSNWLDGDESYAWPALWLYPLIHENAWPALWLGSF